MKGLTTTQLLTRLAIAVVIIGILVWLLVVKFNVFGTNTSKTECQGRLIGLCGQWALCGYGDCYPESSANKFDDECNNHFESFSKDLCEKTLPGG